MNVNINRIERENNYEDGMNVINNREDKGFYCRQKVLSNLKYWKNTRTIV